MRGDEHSYFLSRGFSANARSVSSLETSDCFELISILHRRTTLQHYLYKDGLNYLTHPSIPIDKEGLRVAEIGVGTW